MQASPERHSSGWSPTIIAALTSAVLLCVVWKAGLLVGQLQKQTAAAAVSKLVNASPGDVCINATSDTNGTKASVWFACESSEPDQFRIAATPGAVLRKQAFSPLMVSDVIYMLEHCRMLQGWYDKSVLLRFVDPTKEITGSPLNQSSMDIIAAFEQHDRSHHWVHHSSAREPSADILQCLPGLRSKQQDGVNHPDQDHCRLPLV